MSERPKYRIRVWEERSFGVSTVAVRWGWEVTQRVEGRRKQKVLGCGTTIWGRAAAREAAGAKLAGVLGGPIPPAPIVQFVISTAV